MIIELNPGSKVPIYEQIRAQISIGIATGLLASGDSLVPIRELAARLGISNGSVVKAYALLQDERLVQANRKGGTVVSGRHSEREFEAFVDRWSDSLTELVASALALGIPPTSVRDLCLRVIDGNPLNSREATDA